MLVRSVYLHGLLYQYNITLSSKNLFKNLTPRCVCVHVLPTDNELPDYIMVMLANNKTVHQINNDLQLFLGENTDRFTAWLQRAITDPAALMERDTETSQVERKCVCV